MAPSSQRQIFLDVARATAIAVMVFAHFVDQLLDPAFRTGTLARLYDATRGFTAPMFFTVSGWTFAVLLLRKADFPRRFRRAALLILLGYALTLPWWAEGFPFEAAPEVWGPFWAAGVLQTLGLTLAIATALLWAVRVPQAFVALSAVLALLTVAAAPWVEAQAALWPVAVRGYFDPRGVAGGFPLQPWAGYFFAGAALGGGLLLRHANPRLRVMTLVIAAASCALLQWVLPNPHQLVAMRLGWVMGLLAITAAGTASITRLPKALRTLSGHALTFYVVHMVVLWGAPRMTGLVFRIGPQLDWLGCATVTVACLIVTGVAIEAVQQVARLVQAAPAEIVPSLE